MFCWCFLSLSFSHHCRKLYRASSVRTQCLPSRTNILISLTWAWLFQIYWSELYHLCLFPEYPDSFPGDLFVFWCNHCIGLYLSFYDTGGGGGFGFTLSFINVCSFLMITHSLAANSYSYCPRFLLFKATSNPPSVVPEKRVFPPSNLPILPQNQSHQFFEYLLNIFLCSLCDKRGQRKIFNNMPLSVSFRCIISLLNNGWESN